MRITQLIRVASFAVLGLLGVHTSVKAQSVVLPSISRIDHWPVMADDLVFETEITSRVSEKPMDLVDVKWIKARAVNPAVQAQISDLNAATAEVLGLITSEALRAGNIEVAMKTVKAVSLIDEHTVNIKVHYDSRPVGGILTVRVSMTPSFRGVGISTRPAVSRSVAQAVDELTESFVKGMVSDLTDEIKAEFARMEESGSVIEVDGK